MTLALGCSADDYTGASDLANTLSKAGLRTVQTIGVPDDLALPDMDAVVVALKSRSIEAGGGRARWPAPRRRARCDARRCRGRDRAGHAGVSGDRPHRLPGQPVRRRGAAERKPAEGP